jgi:anthranilate phosphoribosyltransferase
VYDAALVAPITHVVARLGVRRAFIVHGHGGLDEISLSGPTSIGFVDNGRVSFKRVEPNDFGLEVRAIKTISGGDPKKNAALSISVLNGEPGPCRDIVLMNSAAALVAAGIAPSFSDGMVLSRQSIDSGSAVNKLNQLISLARLLKGGQI